MTPRHQPTTTVPATTRHPEATAVVPAAAIPAPFIDVVEWAHYAQRYGDFGPLHAALLTEVKHLRALLTPGLPTPSTHP